MISNVINYAGDRAELYALPRNSSCKHLELISASAKEYLNGCFGNMPDNNILFKEDYLYIDEEEASKRGISEGDQVIVSNDRGQLHRTARVLKNRIAEGTVYTYPSCWTNYTSVEAVNDVTSDARAEIGRGVTFQSCMVEVKRA